MPPLSDLTGINANPTYYPAGMKYVIKTRLYFATLILHILSFGLFILASLPWYFPPLVAKKDTFQALGIKSTFLHVFIGIALFVSNWFIPVSGLRTFNDINNFYAPAPCGTKRQLFPGVLMWVNEGNAYRLVWAAWCMVYLVGTVLMIIRVCWVKGDAAGREMDAALASRAEKEARKAARKALSAQRKAEEDTYISEKGSLHSTFKSSSAVVDCPV